VNHFWMQAHWGGAVCALGASLAIGAFGRSTWHHTFWLLEPDRAPVSLKPYDTR
jgi:hypothetical protein